MEAITYTAARQHLAKTMEKIAILGQSPGVLGGSQLDRIADIFIE